MADDPRSLRVSFETNEKFRSEYAGNIANGGIFIATNVGFNVRELVRVEIALGWCGERVELDGEVVHVVGAEMASAGATPGVAVQFTCKASDVRQYFEEYLGAEAAEDEERAGIGRRKARRSTARVPVSVRGPDGAEYDGRSRDLSTSGILVVVEGPSFAVGEKLTLTITNSSTSEMLELQGEVMRHVRSFDDGPIALGVRFAIPPSLADEASSFIQEVMVAEHSRRMGGITGPISEIGIENLLQMFGTCAPKGTLTLIRAEEEGFILFEKAMLRGAQLGETYGRKALSRLLAWREGSFEFHARTDPYYYRGDPLPLDAAILDAFRLQDEAAQTMEALPDDARLSVDAGALEDARSELSQAEEAITDLASVGMTISKVVDVIPEPDVEVRQAIMALVARGIITVDT